MIDIKLFYDQLLEQAQRFLSARNMQHYIAFSSVVDTFPEGVPLRFKKEVLSRLEANAREKNAAGLMSPLSIIGRDGADRDYTELLLSLLNSDWHTETENIVSLLEDIKDPRSIEKLYQTAIDVPLDDDMRALAKKCIWALRAIGTPEAISKLRLLAQSDDMIIAENSVFQLKHIDEAKS